MSWRPRRFWKAVTVAPEGDGWAILLDGRPARTPGKRPLILPSAALADQVAAEWQAQQGELRPETMPATRMANTALEKVGVQSLAVARHLAAYGDTDLLCYRAGSPPGLVARQADAWDPLIDWAATDLDAPLTVTVGVMHVPQPEASLARLETAVAALDPFRLTAFHDLVALAGSLVLALAVARGRLSPEAAWDISRIDETWQIEEWGADEEAAELAAQKRQAFLDAARFFTLCG